MKEGLPVALKLRARKPGDGERLELVTPKPSEVSTSVDNPGFEVNWVAGIELNWDDLG